MAKWSDIREKHLGDPEVAEEYMKLPSVEFIAQIIRARKSKGLTQEDLAKAVGTKQPAIARIESGKYLGCSINTLLKIADALDTPFTIRPRKSMKLKALESKRLQTGTKLRKAAER